MVNKVLSEILQNKELDIERRRKEKELILFHNVDSNDLEIRIDKNRLDCYINEVNKENIPFKAPAPNTIKSGNDSSTNMESLMKNNYVRFNKCREFKTNTKYNPNKVSLYDM
jgi:hypothetical protein